MAGSGTGFFLRTSLRVEVQVQSEFQTCLVLWESRRWGDLGAASTGTLGIGCGYPQRVWVRLNNSTDSSLVVDRRCDRIDASGVWLWHAYTSPTSFILNMNNPRRGYLEHC